MRFGKQRTNHSTVLACHESVLAIGQKEELSNGKEYCNQVNLNFFLGEDPDYAFILLSPLIDDKYLLNRKDMFTPPHMTHIAACLDLGPDVCEAPFADGRPKSNCHTLNLKHIDVCFF